MAIPKYIMQLHCCLSTNSTLTAEALEAVEAVGGIGSSRFRALEK